MASAARPDGEAMLAGYWSDLNAVTPRLIRRKAISHHGCVACGEMIAPGERMTIEEFDGMFLDRDRYHFYHARCHPIRVDREFKRIPRNHWSP